MTTENLRAEHDRIIDVLADARSYQGWTQNRLAKKMGACNSTVSNIETGGKFPSLSTLIRYADAVGLKLELIPKETNIGPIEYVR